MADEPKVTTEEIMEEMRLFVAWQSIDLRPADKARVREIKEELCKIIARSNEGEAEILFAEVLDSIFIPLLEA